MRHRALGTARAAALRLVDPARKIKSDSSKLLAFVAALNYYNDYHIRELEIRVNDHFL